MIQGEADVRGVPFDVVAEGDRQQPVARALHRSAKKWRHLCLLPRLAAAFMITGQDIAIDGHVETFHIK